MPLQPYQCSGDGIFPFLAKLVTHLRFIPIELFKNIGFGCIGKNNS